MHPPMKKRTMSSKDISGIKKLIPLTDEEIITGYDDSKEEATRAEDMKSHSMT